jgi:single-stranded-DNA-specific exonuclease
MGGAEDAVRLLLARDPQEASGLAAKVEALNLERRTIQQDLFRRLPVPDGSPFDLVIDAGAHKGVIGIVAGQRMRESGVPTAVCTILDGIAQGSLRAPEGYDLGALLDLARPFLRSGGGHRLAAGISFELSRLPFVREAMRRGAAEQAAVMAPPALDVDGAATDLIPPHDELAKLEPFGQGFPEPVVILEGKLQDSMRTFGNGHRKLRINGHPTDLVWFSSEEATAGITPGDFLRLAVSPQDHPRWGRSWQIKAALGTEADPGGRP